MAKLRKNLSVSHASRAARIDRAPPGKERQRLIGLRMAMAAVSAATASRSKRPITGTDASAGLKHACALLKKYLGARAGTEALLHAFLASRDNDHPAAQFWIDVYRMMVETRKRA